MTRDRPKLVLVNPNPYPKERLLRRPPFTPLGPLFVAACTPNHWDIEIIDESTHPIDFGRGVPRADLVGIGAMTVQAHRAIFLATEFKQRDIPVVLGGMHFSALADDYLDLAHIVVGEAEGIWPKVIQDFESNRLTVNNHKVYRCQGHPSLTGIDLPRDLIDQRRYLLPTIQASRGCPHKCSFCSVPQFFGHIIRFRPVEEVMAEIFTLPGNKFIFIDDNLYARKSWARELLESLIRQKRAVNKSWACQARIEDLTDDWLDLVSRAGCVGIYVGLESVSKENRKVAGKDIDLRKYTDRITAAHKKGLCTIGSFIVGLDADGPQVFDDTLEFVFSAGLDIVQYAIPIPLPGTTLEQELIKQRRYQRPDDPSQWQHYSGNKTLFEPKRMTSRQLDEGLIYCYQKTYSWLGILRRLSIRRTSLFLSIVGNLGFRQAFGKWMKRKRR